MSRFSKMDAFLKYLAKIVEEGKLLPSREIYSLLNKYDVSEEDLTFDADPDIVNGEVNEDALFYKWRVELRDHKKLFGFNDGYWFQIRNREGYREEKPNDYIKMYIPLDAAHLENGVGRIMGFLANEGIYHVSKVGKHIRFDDVVVRLTNPQDAYRLAEFIKNDSYIQEGLIEADPFAIQKDGIAYACDGSMSYNSVVASLISLYIEEENNKMRAFDSDKLDLSFEGFRTFATNFYNDLVLNPEKQKDLAKYFCDSLSFNKKDCMHIIELVCHSMDPDFTYDDYLEFYRENVYNYNRKYELLSMPPVVEMNNANNSFQELWNNIYTVLLDLPTVKGKEKIDLELLRLELKRGMLLQDIEDLDLAIASKKEQLKDYEDVELFDFDDKVVISYLNVSELMKNIKLVKDNVYGNEFAFARPEAPIDTVDLNINFPAPHPDDVSSLSDEVAEELLHRCNRYKMCTNWKQMIEKDMEDRNVGSLQELLALIQREKPKEYNEAKRSYEEKLIGDYLRDHFDRGYTKEGSTHYFKNENGKMEAGAYFPTFEYDVEYTYMLSYDDEVKIEVGKRQYNESEDGPLYIGKIDIETGEVAEVPGLFGGKIDIHQDAKISFQVDIPDYLAGQRYCIYDPENDVYIRFEHNRVKVMERERNYSIDPPRREERVEMLMNRIVPWQEEKEETVYTHGSLLPPAGDAVFIEEEKIARDKLKHCKMFAGYTEKDAVIDAIISDPNNSVSNARDMVKIIKEKEPAVYREMEAAYATANTVAVQPAVSMSR